MAKKKAASKKRSAPQGSESETKDPASDASSASKPGLSFEQALREVEQIVDHLEGGELTLEQSLKQYESGVAHLRRCHELLQHVERRVELLTGFDQEGRPVTEPFDTEALSLEEKQRARGRRRSTPDEDASSDVDTANGDPGDIDAHPGLF